MGASSYKNFIKQYDTIRDILRKFYIYGCYSRQDFESFDVDDRKYDNEYRRLKNFIIKENIVENNINQSKQVGFKYDMFETNENFLANSFFIKVFKIEDLNYYFLIQQILNCNANSMSCNEIFKKFPAEFACRVSESTLKRKLNSMVENKIIKLDTVGKKKLYTIEEDFFANFTTEEIKKIFYAIKFYCNIALLSSQGYYLLDTIRNYLRYERKVDFNENDVFLFKYNLLSKIVDDDIIGSILEARRLNKKIEFYYNKNANIKDSNKKKNKINKLKKVIPVKIITDYYYGRQYLFCIDENKEKDKCLYRLDKLNNIKLSNESYEDSNYDEFIKDSWGATLLDENKGLTCIEIDFYIDEHKERCILNRLKKECEHGEVIKLQEGRYLLKIKVSDPISMIPWIRSFSFHAKVRSSDTHDLKERLENDWKEALKNYECI